VIVLHGTILQKFVIQIAVKQIFAIWRTYESVDLRWFVLPCGDAHPGRSDHRRLDFETEESQSH
jgi:hypothetical protein